MLLEAEMVTGALRRRDSLPHEAEMVARLSSSRAA
jgi:DNA-binding GntR family transcriptional regulator